MIKQFLRATIGLSGRRIPSILRRLDESLTIFALHDVTDEPSPFTDENGLWSSKKLFRNQMEFAAENFNVISMEDALKGEIPTRAAMVTFDDGFAGTFENGLPVLNEMGLPSTVFLNMSPIFGENFWSEKTSYLCGKVPAFQPFIREPGNTVDGYSQLNCTPGLVDRFETEHGDAYLDGLSSYMSPYATLANLQEADASPLVTLGSHLYIHYNVKNLSDQDLAEQYGKNSAALSQYRRYLPVFAFPFGHPDICFSTHQANFLLRQGAIRLFTGWPRPNRNHTAKLLDRIPVTPWHDRINRLWFQVIKSPLLETFGRNAPPLDYESVNQNA